MKRVIQLAAAMLMGGALFAQTNPTPQALPYTETFSGTAHTSTIYPAGWQGWTVTTAPGSAFSTAAPTADRTLTASSTAAVNSGNVHNYDGKIGFLNTGSLDLALVLALNTTNMTNVKLKYDIMTLRNPYDGTTNSRINELTLQYRIGTSGTFTSLTGMEYSNNTTTQTTGVTTPQNVQSKLVTLPSACNNQAVVQLRWISRQVSGGGARPSFAVDNVVADTSLKPTISVSKGVDGTEGTSPVAGTFTFDFSPATAAVATFNYSIGGTAAFNTDYTVTLTGATPSAITSTTGTITVPASMTSVVATITPIDDALSEGTETVTISISAPSGSYAIGDTNATINIFDDEATRIHDIQGSGMNAVAGNFSIEGIVTGVYPGLSPAGFYMQEEDADADANPATSEGIFVVTGTAFTPGDKVKVTGTSLESGAAPSYSQAVLNNTTITLVSSGNPLPTPVTVTMPVTSVNDFEKYEGMLVKFTDTLTVTDVFNLGRYGEISLSKGGMVYQPTQIVDPNDAVASGTTASGNSNVAAVTALATANANRTIVMDDGTGTMTTLPFVNTDNTLRLGSTITNLNGILGYAFSVYRIQPVPHVKPVFNYAPRPATVPFVGDSANLRIASFNVLNYFNGDGTGGGYPTARGAHSAAEFTRQRTKIINALDSVDADVVGLIEMENDGTGANSALQDLVNGLNAQMGANTYSFINDGATIQTNGTDAIRCAIIYKAAKVSPVGNVMISNNTAFDRPPVAQTFSLVANGKKFNYIINHFKSKGCSGSTGADADLMDGQSCYNDRRKKQAGALVNFINMTVIPASGSGMVLTMGDYNAYYEEDPMDSLRAAGYTVLGTATTYSYLYFGQVGSLDYAVCSDSLKSKITGVAKWNINSAEPTYLDYNDNVNDGSGDQVNQWGNLYTTSPFRSSDHDPVIVGIKLADSVTPPGTVANAEFRNMFAVYPNPASHVLQVENKTGAACSWQIVGMAGNIVNTGNMTAHTYHTTIDMQPLAQGVYFLRINADGAQANIKVIKL